MQNRFTYLFNQLWQEAASIQEKKEFFSLLDCGQYDELFQELMEMVYQQDVYDPDEEVEDKYLLPGAQRRMAEHIFKQGIVATEAPTRKLSLWPRIAIAAAVATVIVSAGIWFLKQGNTSQPTEVVSGNDVAPGKQGATLTLASGKKIKLSDATKGELAKEAGVIITKSADGQLLYEIKGSDQDPNKMNTLSTAIGETYQLKLPDGSQVWLNAASSLTYAASLIEKGKRVVELRGEGYFEVFKDSKHPFVVKTDQQEVEVLGTRFNVNAYTDEKSIKTTLVEGSVKINNSTILKPGQQSALSGSNRISVQEVNTENITDWKDGEFNLDGLDMRTAMRKIARWYDVDVIYDESVPANINAGGWISRDTPLSAILKVIERSGLVHFKVEGRKVYVSR